MSDDKERNKKVEIEIFNRFSRIVKEKFTSLADGSGDGGDKTTRLDVLYKQPEFQSEKQIITEMNNMGLSKGVMSGLACFAFLRISPRAISRMLQRRAGVGPQGTANPFNRGTANPFNKTSGYKLDPIPGQQQPNLERPGLAFRAVRLALDTFVSLSIGAYSSMFFVDKEKMMNEFSEIPLVEGRSLLSEELCEDFTREFQKFDRQTWDPKHSALSGGVYATDNDGDHDFRNVMQGFVVNCRKRALYEEEKRKESGLRRDEPVIIPSPGVPRDISVSLDDLLGNEDFGESVDDAKNGDDYFDTYFDMGEEEKD